MFHKPFRIKSQTAIKNSDRKKLRNEIKTQFPNLTEDEFRDLVPNKEEMTIMKVFTHAEDTAVVYCLKKNPIFFEVEKVVYPTVYTLWRYPDLLPTFTTWAPVISNLQRGADLMLPGVIPKTPVTPETYKHLEKGIPASVNLLPNKAPIAVGKTALSGSDMYLSAMRGKGVALHHVYKDHLWAHGDKSHPPELGMAIDVVSGLDGNKPKLTETKLKDTNNLEEKQDFEDDNLCEKLNSATLESSSGRTTDVNSGAENGGSVDQGAVGYSGENDDLGEVTGEDGVMEGNDGGMEGNYGVMEGNDGVMEGNDGVLDGGDSVQEAVDPVVEKEQMDQLLYQCLLHALKASVKKSDYPILTSKLLHAHLIPCCPPGKKFDLRKSSYKKLSKFLKEMEKKNLLIMKELSKGVESVTDVNRAHPDLRSFVVPDLPDREEEEEEEDEDDKPFVPPEVVEMFGVSAAVLPLFSPAGYKKGSALSTADVRKVLTEYVKENELKDKVQKGVVVLDARLTDMLFKRGDVTHVRYDELIKRCLDIMSPMQKITYPGEEPTIKKGKIEPVVFTIAQRGGNKKVTLIENLEQFGISPKAFAHEVQIGVACSTSVSPLPGKARGMQVLVQGNQINFVAELLSDKYQLNKKYLLGLEKAPKGKKKK